VVGELERLGLIVRDEQRGDASLLVEAVQPVAQLLPHAGVQRAEGLVEQEDLGLGGQRPREGDALALPSRELRRQPGPPSSRLDQVEQPVNGPEISALLRRRTRRP
jgi:hypothetical protein